MRKFLFSFSAPERQNFRNLFVDCELIRKRFFVSAFFEIKPYSCFKAATGSNRAARAAG